MALEATKKMTGECKFAYKNVGYGVVSYEMGHGPIEQQDGKLFTDTFESDGMVWKDGQGWLFDSGLGLQTYAIAWEDLTPMQQAEAEIE